MLGCRISRVSVAVLGFCSYTDFPCNAAEALWKTVEFMRDGKTTNLSIVTWTLN